MTEPFDKIDCVKLYAGRIRFYANAIVELHDFGHETGADEEPWGPTYQRKAVRVYLDVLPAAYLQQLAAEFLGCSATMAQQPDPPAELAEHWRIVDAYFRNGAEAICDALDFTTEPRWEDPVGKEPTTPAGVAFAVLAPYITADSAIRLRAAGHEVAECLQLLGTECPLDSEQVRLLAAIASGRTLAQIAEDLCFAERTLYRRLKELYRAMKVPNREQAIARASGRGWLQ